jgi:dipeptidyl aminopeptidase/acylaminoacyl peptidase
MRRRGTMVLLLLLVLCCGDFRPAGGQAATATPSGRIAYQGADHTLRVVAAAGGAARTIATRGHPFAPRWSPDGSVLVYSDELADAPYRGQLALADPATGGTRVLVPEEARDPDLGIYWSFLQPRWTPDGGSVVYIRSGGSRAASIMRVGATGGTPQELLPATNTTRFDLSPTDGRFALSDDAFAEERVQGSRLVVLDPDGGGERQLLPRAGVYYFQPTWTVDGTGIVVRRQAARDSATATLVLVDAATGTQRTLGTVAGGSGFALSPDGGWLAVAAGDTGRLGLVAVGDFRPGAVLGEGMAPAWEPAPTTRLFGATGFRVGGRFLAYWEAHGGLPLYGYPLTDELRERLEDGREYTVQYFERARLEYHPENADPRDQILLGQFGRRMHPPDPAATPLPDATYVAATGHNLRGRFLDYWGLHGGLAQFGYPISEEFIETLEDGRPYAVQYFERARFEYHPEVPDPQYRVLLGQFGRRILAQGGAR